VIIPSEYRGARILLVDDNEASRYLFGRWLQNAGFEVFEAADGADALAHLENGVPDLAVLDVNLPDMSGFDILECIKAIDPSVAVLHVSATFVEVADRAEGLQRGADAYLVEPIERDELLSSVVALLRYSTARRAAERLTGQMAALHHGMMGVHGATTVDDVAEVAAVTAARVLDRTLAVIAYAEREGAVAIADPSGLCVRDVYQPRALASAAGTNQPVEAGTVSSVVMNPFSPPDELLPLFDAFAGGIAEAITTRHSRGAGVAGLLVQGQLTESSDRLLASQIVQSVAVAVDNLRLYEVERGMALTLQRALLPESSPPVRGMHIATRYVASDEHSEVGGDFFDVFAMPDDRVALVIGDVQGHSLEAASVMGDLRAGLRAYSTEGLEPADVVARTNDLFMQFAETQSATLCFAVVEPATRRLTVVNAGHLPPLIATDDGAWWLTGGSTLVGFRGRPPAQTVFALPDECMMVFVTDGLVEHRTRSVEEGLAAVAASVRRGSLLDVDAVCQRLLDDCLPETQHAPDDVAILVARFAEAATHGRREPAVVDGDQMKVSPVA